MDLSIRNAIAATCCRLALLVRLQCQANDNDKESKTENEENDSNNSHDEDDTVGTTNHGSGYNPNGAVRHGRRHEK